MYKKPTFFIRVRISGLEATRIHPLACLGKTQASEHERDDQMNPQLS